MSGEVEFLANFRRADAMAETRLSRAELYMRIWDKPLRSVASELGISDVGLAKMCKRNGIPTPPQGYHLRKPGYAKKRLVIPLPPIQQGQESSFVFNDESMNTKQARPDYREAFITLVAEHNEKQDEKTVRQVRRHIKHLAASLNLRKVDERGIMLVPDKYYPIRVSSMLFERAVNVLTTLLSDVVSLGATMRSNNASKGNERLEVDWMAYRFSFRVEEHTKRVDVPKKERPKRYGGYEYPSDAWRLIPTGLLTVYISGPFHLSLTIRDGKNKVEERISEILKKMFISIKQQQEQERIESIRMQKAISHLQEKDALRREEEFHALRKKQLIREVGKWRHAQRIRQYVSAVEQAGYQSGQSFESKEAWIEWVRWAHDYVDSLDPLCTGTAGETPPYPEQQEITKVPYAYLQFDDPEEAEAEMAKNWWMR
jgi:hypothetical protein